MSRASWDQVEAQTRFQEAVENKVFSEAELRAMLVVVSRFVNDFVLDTMLAETEQKSLKDL